MPETYTVFKINKRTGIKAKFHWNIDDHQAACRIAKRTSDCDNGKHLVVLENSAGERLMLFDSNCDIPTAVEVEAMLD